MLYICPTPIGNLQDVTLRVLDTLGACDFVACEDTRHTKILLERHGIEARLVSFHEHNEEQRLAMLLPWLREDKNVAVVSDAGMPGLSDPGFTLVRACVAEGLPVTVLPGPSAVSTALVLSALPADRFAFVGFLARGAGKIVEQLAVFEGTGAALVAFESPRRLPATLAAIAARWPERQVVVCRELSKIHEEAVRGTAAEVVALLGDPVRGEIVLVLEPSPPAGRGAGASGAQLTVGDVEGRARAALREMGALGLGTKTASGIVAGLTGLPARRAYKLALEVKREAGA
jgi:16S rRNA (cytidine1402-2'-O)-methyltransferase